MSTAIEEASRSDHGPRSVHYHFQIIIRLQWVRTQVTHLLCFERPCDPRALDELYSSFCSVTFAAREAGFAAFTMLCRRVSHRLDEMIVNDAVSNPFLRWVNEWAASAELYIRRPRFHHFARAVVLHLKHPIWGVVMDDETQVRVIDQLTSPYS